MDLISNITYGNAERNNLDLYLPKNKEKFNTLVFFHGGGLENGCKDANQDAFSTLADNGIAVISANYRTYPSAKYPEFIEDAAAAVNWTFQNINKHGVCNKIYIAGSSAGAYISMMLCFDKRYLGKYGIDSNDIAGYIFDAAQPTTHFNVLRERGFDTRKVVIDEAAPIYHIQDNFKHSPMLIILAENDITNRLEQNILFRSTLRIFGYNDTIIGFKIMNGYSHCGYHHVVDDKGRNIYAKMIMEFIRSQHS